MAWHARALSRTLVALGVNPTPIRLTACGFATSSLTGLAIDGLGTALPDAIVVRSMSGGSFEAVTLRLGILHAAPHLGALVWHDARPIERCRHNSITTFPLPPPAIPTPPPSPVES